MRTHGISAGVSLLAAVVATTRPLTIVEMVVWAAVLSFVGGCASSMRRTDVERPILTLIQYGLNTGVMGASLAMMAWYWVAESPTMAWVIVGATGILSLGGLATIDAVVSVVRQRLEKKVSEIDE